MRAYEFLFEYKKYPTQDYEGIKISMVEKDGRLFVRAIDDWGVNELGSVEFVIGDGKELDPQDLRVDDRYQGQGIARTMYDYVKSQGYKIVRSWDQTDAGAGFWNKHRGEDVRVWEQGVAEGKDGLENISTINDDWFKQGSFQTYKKPSAVKYQQATIPGTVKTLEGPVRYKAGHYIMTGPKGEQYPITPEKFNSLYDNNGDGTATPKKIQKLAKLADHDGVLHTSWGDLRYTSGNDYIVRHGANDYGAVKKDIFAQTYAMTQGMAEASDHMLAEEQPEVRPHRVTDKELVQLLGKGKTNAMLRHPWFQRYSSYEKAYRYARDRWGFVTVDMFPYMTSVNKTADGSIRPTIYVSFVFSYTGPKVVQAHQFRRDQEPDEFEKRNPVTGGWKHGSTWKVDKMDDVTEDDDQSPPIRINSNARALAWIKKVYAAYPQTWQNNHVMPLGGSGEDQQFAMFELVPSMSQRGAVEVKWFQAYPLRQGVGTRAMQELQRLAQADGIALTLFPWDKGQVSQSKLMKFYKGVGFRPTVKGSKSLAWSPESVTENFADGKGPGRPGDSQRHGIPKNATMAELEKASHAKGRKGQLARWQINMRNGRKK